MFHICSVASGKFQLISSPPIISSEQNILSSTSAPINVSNPLMVDSSSPFRLTTSATDSSSFTFTSHFPVAAVTLAAAAEPKTASDSPPPYTSASPVVTTHFRPQILQVKTESTAVDLPTSLNLSMNSNQHGTGVSTSIPPALSASIGMS